MFDQQEKKHSVGPYILVESVYLFKMLGWGLKELYRIFLKAVYVCD